MKITILIAIVILALACNLTVTSAYPYPDSLPDSIDRFDRDVRNTDSESASDYDYRKSRLRRTYYYDDGYDSYYPYYESYSAPYSAPSPIRRQDTDIDRAYKYEPIVRYSATRTKRKKLFVPNLWG